MKIVMPKKYDKIIFKNTKILGGKIIHEPFFVAINSNVDDAVLAEVSHARGDLDLVAHSGPLGRLVVVIGSARLVQTRVRRLPAAVQRSEGDVQVLIAAI